MATTDDGRRSVIYTHQGNDRDHGKQFKLTEMYSDQAEEWAMRAFFAMNTGGAEIPDDIAARGLEGLAGVAISALMTIPWALAKPLLDEMMDCVTVVTNAGIERKLMRDDVQEMGTRLLLRKEIVALHTGFFAKGDQSPSQDG